MICIHNLEAPLTVSPNELKKLAADKLGVKITEISALRILKQAVDARRKNNIRYVYTLECKLSGQILTPKDKDITAAPEEEIFNLDPRPAGALRPLIVGSGPAGMLAGLALAEAGLKPLILERGKDVLSRRRDADLFWQTGRLNVNSNVQFGEGGAGTFSDGKLMTGIKKDKYVNKVLQEFVSAGAPKEIRYLAKPHIGTDNLAVMVRNIRRKIESLGGEYRFENRLCGLVIKNGCLTAVQIEDRNKQLLLEPCKQLILAIGHSARDTFEMLYDQGILMEQKPFSVGARIEHPQALINKAQYGAVEVLGLGAADYKLAVHLPNGRSAYTFCMCPGGCVVAAASEDGRVVTNGMSEYARNRENANAALLVGVGPADFGSEHPLAGMYFQRRIEQQAFVAGGQTYAAPAQLVGDFLKNIPSRCGGSVLPSYRPGVCWGSLENVLPAFVTSTMQAAIVQMDKKLHGFAMPDAVLTAPETRSSSPVRIIRGEDMQSNVKGIYPCGEGAGYAGGITSAAADGLRVAEVIAAQC